MSTASPEPTSLLVRAFHFAAERHRSQRRKGIDQAPYINHLIDVAHILMEEGGVTDVTTIAAGILHDTIEDTKTSFQDLVEAFGPGIAGIVSEVTDDKSMEKQERKQAQIEHAPGLSPRAAALKLADKISNVRELHRAPPEGWSADRKREYTLWARRVVDGIVDPNGRLLQVFLKACEETERHLPAE